MTLRQKLEEAFKASIFLAHAWVLGTCIGKLWEDGRIPSCIDVAKKGIYFFIGCFIIRCLVEFLRDKDWKYNPFYKEL